MIIKKQHYIDGKWVDTAKPNDFDVINPATEEVIGVISLGNCDDVDQAVIAARKAFIGYSKTTIQERVVLLEKLLKIYQRRYEEIAQIMTLELGAPIDMCRDVQTDTGVGILRSTIEIMQNLKLQEILPSGDQIWLEPIGVCGLITPWNWPINQMAMKVIPALAAGCTVILKPSELTPLSAIIYAEIFAEAGFPAGVFNLVNGDGPTVGSALSCHRDIDMMSFTGSSRGGIAVLKDSADTVKKVTLELGGNSANIVFADADLEKLIPNAVSECFFNTGQSCDAPVRLLVEQTIYDQVVQLATDYANSVQVGDPTQSGDFLGPLISATHHERVSDYIDAGIAEGARLVVGGAGKPEGFSKGYYVRPTIFVDVGEQMRIYQEEIFGPVLTISPFLGEADAIRMANDTDYGLASYIQTSDKERAKRVAQAIRVGGIHINGAAYNYGSPFGGYKQSGTGREGGRAGIEDFMELKTVHGL